MTSLEIQTKLDKRTHINGKMFWILQLRVSEAQRVGVGEPRRQRVLERHVGAAAAAGEARRAAGFCVRLKGKRKKNMPYKTIIISEETMLYVKTVHN